MQRVLLVLTMIAGLMMLYEPMYGQTPENGNTRSGNQTPSIDEVIPVMIPPQTINLDEVRNMIGYPRKAQELGIDGTVNVRILVDKEGDYKRHKILSTPHRLLSDAVNKNVHKIIFTPAIDNDRQPIMYWVNIPVHFQLKKKTKSRRFRRN